MFEKLSHQSFPQHNSDISRPQMFYVVSFDSLDGLLILFEFLKDHVKKINLVCDPHGIRVYYTNEDKLFISSIPGKELGNYACSNETSFSVDLTNNDLFQHIGSIDKKSLFAYVTEYDPWTWVIEVVQSDCMKRVFKFTNLLNNQQFHIPDISYDYIIDTSAYALHKICSDLREHLSEPERISFRIFGDETRLTASKKDFSIEEEIHLNTPNLAASASDNYQSKLYRGTFNLNTFISLISQHLGTDGKVQLHFKETLPLLFLYKRGLMETQLFLVPYESDDDKNHY